MSQPANPADAAPGDLGQTAIECYLSALLAVGKALTVICPHIGSQYQNPLLRLRKRVAFKPTCEGLTGSMHALAEDLGAFSLRTSAYFEQKAGDVATLLSLLEKAVETFECRDMEYLERVGRLAGRMQEMLDGASENTDFRSVCERQLGELRRFLDELAADNKVVFDRLASDLHVYEERLLQSEAEAVIDPLTSLVNRRELERHIWNRAAKKARFSLLLFDVRSLRSVNERFGYEAGDQVLRQFGARLVAQVRPRDVVARWGEDEFAVIFDCQATSIAPRARQIAQWVSGKYPVTVNGREWKPDVEACVTVVEYEPGEAPGDFVLRVSAQVPSEAPDLVPASA